MQGNSHPRSTVLVLARRSAGRLTFRPLGPATAGGDIPNQRGNQMHQTLNGAI